MTFPNWILIGLTLAGAIIATFGVALMSRREPEIVRPEDGLATTPIGRLKAVIQSGDWNKALPPVLVMSGLILLMVFGSLCLVIIRGQLYGGGIMLVVAVAAIVKLVRDWQRGA
ncbi:hypothetical protein OAE84_00450 [bacterium]|nr:hypothetical protein [bacterium]HAC80384.1 hypothetical protein [Deltaproteobacteria bacterium]|tara:strand:- start:25 stop:366 length:342 start_codon:yes stop_codon:yes gene_type:complete